MSPRSNAEGYPAILLQLVEGKTQKNHNQATCRNQDSNPDPLISRLDVLTVTPQRWTSYLASECDGGDNAGEMSPEFSTDSYPAFAQIGLRGKPRRKPQPAILVLPNIANETTFFRRLRWAGHVARMGESRNAYRVLVGWPAGKRPLGRPRRRWEDNIKMVLRGVGYDGRDWINLAQDRDQWRAYVRAAMKANKIRIMESNPGRGRGVELYSQVPKANAWIFNNSGLSTSEWVTCLKMNANLAAVRGVPGRSLDGSRCRHGCPETETLADVQAYSQTTKKGYIIDPTIRIETGSSQPEDVNQEKFNIYLPTVDYFKAKYQLEDIEVIGLLIGARGVIPKFFERFRKTFELPQTLTADIITSVLKRSCQILKEKELAGSLVEKNLPTEGCTGRNGEREKSSVQKKSDDRRH
ncbi:hypothetical protein ANN_18069 [Periplaneta americana]|uniref:Uncharacterized protein n=1 Tax=Periplaneta americana TaxID=6978 RepID=A0ABQ8SNP6_PERAM|nr:hypothetical protein ANN_18069 [Periplaneta americana]